MGITGLIPFLEKSSKKGNISQFSGCTVAVDTYCWLHKGAFSCADKIAMGQPTDAYVRYCIKFVDMLLANRIKPILVFDGCYLPAKAETEIKRRESREANKKRAAELIAMGETSQGRALLRRSIDITHEMALELIKKCHEKNVDCIVAPYEADAQLAYLNISGIADVVITEDSDLTLFGCKKIFFKMDINGFGLLVEQDRLHLAMNLRSDHFDMEKFRHMCILSGCDYLASLPGIGLQKACKFVVKNSDSDIQRALGRLSSYLNMKSLIVTTEYREAFMRALVTFKHQLVFCPLQRKQVRLTPPSEEVTPEQLHHAGDEKPEDLAWNLAIGNCDPITLKKLHNYNPDTFASTNRKTNAWLDNKSDKHVSIWSKNFKIQDKIVSVKKDETTKWPETSNKLMVMNTKTIKHEMSPLKRSYDELDNDLSENDLIRLYGNSNKIMKNDKLIENTNLEKKEEAIEISTPPSSPVRYQNPFLKKTSPTETSPCLVTGRKRKNFRTLIAFQPTVIDDNVVVRSKFFSNNQQQIEVNPKATIIPETQDIDLSNIHIDEYKENSIHANIAEKCPVDKNEEIFPRTDSGVDVDDGEYDESKKSNEKHDIDPSPHDCELSIVKMETNINNLDELMDDECVILDPVTEPQGNSRSDDTLDYAVDNLHVNSLRSSFFKWSNPKGLQIPGASNKDVRVMNKRAQSSNQIKVSTRKPLLKKSISTPPGRQQKLLNMYGFQKKTSSGE
ncbi:hypothetical protein PV327_002458 [Microctonus hyperodae]|uniref:Exonuclease 1 n=1 Tax=Microctonus hyperodae TaxID=165561 RepID=A0AA39FFL5_MICHY|nr:hypothetical protein PV327_002458 [Microctonus hyperodae]